MLVLSMFPGLDVLGLGFELEGCTVLGMARQLAVAVREVVEGGA